MFMQTAAWWQQKMNGQLASWTELRHDNLLYAKQSYTAMTICSYPYGYVEPVPAFFESMKSLAQESIIKLSGLSLDVSGPVNYFQKFSEIMDTLISLSEKELSNQEFSNAEKLFLKNVLFEDAICGPYIDGWYFDLWYNDPGFNQYPLPVDYIAADFHTSPTDAFGSPVGWVKHSGTGPFNLMILNADLPVVGKTTFVGPVCSYYEYTTTNFLRLTDDEWKETYLKQSTRPGWVNIYLADSTGNSRGSGSQLITDAKDDNINEDQIPAEYIIAQNYPNPFNPETIVSFTIPSKLTVAHAEINIYNVQVKLIKKLFAGNVQPGTYLTRWNGKNDFGQNVSSGIYLYEVRAGKLRTTGKMTLIK